MRRTWVAGAALLVFSLAEPVRADMPVFPPPGTHWQATTATVAPGSFLQACVRLHRVREGETLGGLARQHLGAFDRWIEIRDLNPGVDPRALRVGSLLRIPPTERSEEEAKTPLERTWMIAAVREGVTRDWTWIEPTRPLSFFIPEGRRLVALRVDRAPRLFAQALEFQGTLAEFGDALSEEDRASLAIGDHPTLAGRHVEEEDSAWRVDHRYDVTAVAEGTIRLEETGLDRYDAHGKLLPEAGDSSEGAAAGFAASDHGRPARWDLVLAFLAVLAAAALGVVYLRRHGEGAAPTDSAPAP